MKENIAKDDAVATGKLEFWALVLPYLAWIGVGILGGWALAHGSVSDAREVAGLLLLAIGGVGSTQQLRRDWETTIKGERK